MATATARNVDDKDYAYLSKMAEEQGRSVSEELRLMIAEHVRERRAKDAVADFLDHVRRNPIKLPAGITSLDLLREERGSW
jgi:hypothetical protein